MSRVSVGSTLLLIAVVLGVLVSVSVPVDGVEVDVNSPETVVSQGEFITFTTEIVLRGGEVIPIDSIEFRIVGERTSTATFGVDGIERTDRSWVRSIERTFDNTSYRFRPSRYGYDEETEQNVSFGSGRGYGDNTEELPGSLRYEVTVDTSTLAAGDYRVETAVVASDGTTEHDYSSAPIPFTIEGGSQTSETTSEGDNSTDGPRLEERGFSGSDLLILVSILMVLFAAGYYAGGPMYEWYQSR